MGITTVHQSFFNYRQYRYAVRAGALAVLAILAYVFCPLREPKSGGTWLGYTLGTIGALLIVYLAWYGVRRRTFGSGGSATGWLSAHVYFGFVLMLVATLHCGFQFGWNVHTAAYALMMLVIVSGIYGIAMYVAVPAALSNNREEMTQTQMVDALRALDRQLHDAAQPLNQYQADLVQASLVQDPFGGGLIARLSGRYPRCATQRTFDTIRERTGPQPDLGDDPLERIDALLERKIAMLAQLRRHLRLRALLEIWLYVHVPATFALIAALTAHIISVFFYW